MAFIAAIRHSVNPRILGFYSALARRKLYVLNTILLDIIYAENLIGFGCVSPDILFTLAGNTRSKMERLFC